MIQIIIQTAKLRHKLASSALKTKLFIGFVLIVLLTGFSLLTPVQSVTRLLFSGNPEVFANLPILTNGDDLKIHVIDVGQGDATLIEYKSSYVLIDTGPPESGLKLTKYLKALGIKKLDVVVLTHPHDDHLGGAKMISQNFSVGRLLVSHHTKGNSLLEEILREAEVKEIPVTRSLKGLQLQLSDLTLTCLHPLPVDYSNVNNYSSVWSFQYKAVDFLFLADLESDEADHLSISSTAFVRSGHHGSVTSTTRDFLKKLAPRLFAISCGLNNPFGHPSKEVLSFLNQLKINYFRTDRAGTRVISSDGTALRWVH